MCANSGFVVIHISFGWKCRKTTTHETTVKDLWNHINGKSCGLHDHFFVLSRVKITCVWILNQFNFAHFGSISRFFFLFGKELGDFRESKDRRHTTNYERKNRGFLGFGITNNNFLNYIATIGNFHYGIFNIVVINGHHTNLIIESVSNTSIGIINHFHFSTMPQLTLTCHPRIISQD